MKNNKEPAFWTVLKTPVPAKQIPEIRYTLHEDGLLERYDSATGETLMLYKDQTSGIYRN